MRMGSIVQMPVANSQLTSVLLVKALLVGATGFEPVTSSLSANTGEALCQAPLSQVALNRRR